MRHSIRKETLNLDVIADIRKRFPFIQEFWRQHLGPDVMSLPTFYAAMRGDWVNPEFNAQIELALSCLLQADVTLSPDSPAVADLRKCLIPWWLRVSQEDWDKEAAHGIRVATSHQFDAIRAELIRLGVLDEFGYPTKQPHVT